MTRRRVTEESLRTGVDFGWRTHSAITEWTAKVDSKASIVLSLGGVLLGFIVTLSTSNRLLTHLHSWHLVLERIGIAIISLGVLSAALVVAPRLDRRRAKKTWRDNFLYFGHLRHWNPKSLRDRLESLDSSAELDILATQLVVTSKIAWFKHSLLQFSVAEIVIGVGFVAVSVVCR
jgi:Family of unknown function (DUF5706)